MQDVVKEICAKTADSLDTRQDSTAVTISCCIKAQILTLKSGTRCATCISMVCYYRRVFKAINRRSKSSDLPARPLGTSPKITSGQFRPSRSGRIFLVEIDILLFFTKNIANERGLSFSLSRFRPIGPENHSERVTKSRDGKFPIDNSLTQPQSALEGMTNSVVFVILFG